VEDIHWELGKLKVLEYLILARHKQYPSLSAGA
jgi:hypothetical protein